MTGSVSLHHGDLFSSRPNSHRVMIWRVVVPEAHEAPLHAIILIMLAADIMIILIITIIIIYGAYYVLGLLTILNNSRDNSMK